MANITASKSGNPVMFKSIDEAPIRSLKVYFTPVQSGSGDPSPDNVRPISGWTEVNVTRTGKNLLPIPTETVTLLSGVVVSASEGKIQITGTGKSYSVYDINLPYAIPAGTRIVLNGNVVGSGVVTYRVRNIESNAYKQINLNTPKSFSFVVNRIQVAVNPNVEYSYAVENIQLELGSTATPYEPYVGSTYPVSWESEAGTIYGGYVDVVKGEVVATHAKGVVNTSTAGNIGITGDGRIVVGYPAMKSGASQFGVCNIFATYTAGGQNPMMQFGAGNTNLVIYNCSSIWPTVEDFKSYINANTVEIVYPLATPITYAITPTQLSTLRGQNTIMSTANGTIDAEYDLHEAGDIAAIRRRVNQSAPHIVTSTPADIVTFNTDLAAPIKKFRCEFLPVQEGSGDPSPDNVRPISGWTGATAQRTGKNLFNKDDPVLIVENMFPAYEKISHSYNAYLIALPCKPNVTYAIKNTRGSSANVACWAKEKPIENTPIYGRVQNSTLDAALTVTTGDDAKYLIYWCYNNRNSSETYTLSEVLATVQIEFGSTSTTYEPYIGTTIPVDWTDEAGIMYGGYVDLVKGELVQEWEYQTSTWGEIKKFTPDDTTGYQWGYLWFNNPIKVTGSGGTPTNTLCNVGIYNWSGTNTAFPHYYTITTNGEYRMNIILHSETDDNTIIQGIAPLLTPIVHQLTPQQISALRGANNIWSDANGPTTVSYWTH